MRKRHVRAGFKQSAVYPKYLFWNAAGSEGSVMYPTLNVNPTLLAEAEQMVKAAVV